MYKSTFAKNEHGKLKNVQQKQSSETNKKKKNSTKMLMLLRQNSKWRAASTLKKEEGGQHMVTGIQVSNEPVYNTDTNLNWRLVLFSSFYTFLTTIPAYNKLLHVLVCVQPRNFTINSGLWVKKYVKFINFFNFL